MATTVSVRNVSKRFRLYHDAYSSLKERVVHFGRRSYEDFWALHDVSIDIDEGSTVGLIGANGSGKSTLLKCMTGILRPDSGEVAIRGRVAALLELGAGFQPELTGRENVYLNGAILGLSGRELAGKFDEIVAFAELEQFIDAQVRSYSSGMVARLGFAVAVNVDPDVLIIDEVLAVGDESFQRKSFDRITQFRNDGKTIVFVSHNAEQVRQLCDHAAVLDHGRIVVSGTPSDAIRDYREHLLTQTPYGEPIELPFGVPSITMQERHRSREIEIVNVRIDYPKPESGHLVSGESVVLTVDLDSKVSTDDVSFGLAISDEESRIIFGTNTKFLGKVTHLDPGRGRAIFRFTSVPLVAGSYRLTFAVTSRDGRVIYDWREQEDRLDVMSSGDSVGRIELPVSIDVLQLDRTVETG